MLDGLLKAIAEQGREASLVIYLMATLIFGVYALQKEWVVLGKVYRRDIDGCEAKDKALAEVNEKVTEQRILNERATVTIDALRERINDLELDLARAEGRAWHTHSQQKRSQP